MPEAQYTLLQEKYGGRYVACRNAEVIASAETYDELTDNLESLEMDLAQLIIEYIEPVNSVCVY